MSGIEGTIELVRRDVLLSNSGLYGIPDEQLHFPFLYKSKNGNWYMTYREGPHLESRFGVVYQEGTFDAYQEGGNRIVRSEVQIVPQRSP